jgi:outer membrane protein insertion porin family
MVSVAMVMSAGSALAEPERLVAQIRFSGNQVLSDRELAEQMQLRPGAPLRTEELERDVATLAFRYHNLGYAAVKVGPPVLERTESPTSVAISIPIREGESYGFGDVRLAGWLLTSEFVLAKLLLFAEGDRFHRTKLLQSVHERLTDFYRDRGYAFARVSPEVKVDTARRQVDVTLHVTPGGLARVESIRFVGAGKDEERAHRALELREGEIYSSARLRRSRAKLLELFKTVRVQERYGANEGLIRIEFRVKPR